MYNVNQCSEIIVTNDRKKFFPILFGSLQITPPGHGVPQGSAIEF